MTLIKARESSTFGPPPPELFQAITKLGAQAAQAGVVVDTAGLLPTAAGARVRLEHWKGWEGETEVRQLIQPQDSGAGPGRG